MIEVYAVKIPSELDTHTFCRLLEQASPEKQQRIKRFVRQEDRLSSLFAELLIRSIIMRKTGLSNREISFGKNKHGKPYLLGHEDIHFNLSHSGIWVVAAVDSRPVGVDVECISDIDLDLAGYFFSEDEHKDLLNHPDQVSYFFTLWSLKESYIKNIGKGLSQPLDSFSIRFATEDRIVLTSDGKRQDHLNFAEYHIHREYKLSICASRDRLPDSIAMQSAQELMAVFSG
ncbi:MAG: 4'-phosphopantetheinyl transferase superfamily protein [bacterium]|nr:4'-phosphopantetheinyl transferase superfamily protein [bacterium]